MYEKTYGSKYHQLAELAGKESGTYVGAADIAKLMRKDIKAAVAAGELPGSAKYSVTVENYSMGRSINIVVKGLEGAWVECDGSVPGTRTDYADGMSTAHACPDPWCKAKNPDAPGEVHQVLSVEARRVKAVVQGIHNAYNYDGSDIQSDYFDVNYYGQVEIETASSAEWRAKYDADRKAKREAREAGLEGEISKAKVYRRDGKGAVHLVVKVDGKSRLLCGASSYSSSVRGNVHLDTRVTCSRCAKKEVAYVPGTLTRLARYAQQDADRMAERLAGARLQLVRVKESAERRAAAGRDSSWVVKGQEDTVRAYERRLGELRGAAFLARQAAQADESREGVSA